MNRIVEKIYNTHDNTIEWILKTDNQVETNLANADKLILKLDAANKVEKIKDDFGPGKVFDVSQGDGRLILKLGQENIPVGTYKQGQLIVFDVNHPNGVVWEGFTIVVQ